MVGGHVPSDAGVRIRSNLVCGARNTLQGASTPLCYILTIINNIFLPPDRHSVLVFLTGYSSPFFYKYIIIVIRVIKLIGDGQLSLAWLVLKGTDVAVTITADDVIEVFFVLG